MRDIENWYLNYAKSVFYYAFSLCGNTEIAMDIMQTTFLDVIASKSGYNGSCSITTWLFSIAKHEYLKYRKKNKADMNLDEAVFCTIPGSVEETLEHSEESAALSRAVSGLNQKSKRIVILRLAFGLSFAEIGHIVGKSETYCRVNYYRAKLQIVEILKAGGFRDE